MNTHKEEENKLSVSYTVWKGQKQLVHIVILHFSLLSSFFNAPYAKPSMKLAPSESYNIDSR